MDNIYIDVYWFFVPYLILWNHFKNFMGESNKAWTPSVTYQIPQMKFPSGGFDTGTIADYLGVPIGVKPENDWMTISSLPFRAYAMICDQWFRDQNLTDPLLIPLDDTTVTGVNTDNYVTDVALGGKPFKVAKYHDMFSSCLPTPQRGFSVSIFGSDVNSPAGNVFVPVSTSSVPWMTSKPTDFSQYASLSGYVNSNSEGYDGTVFVHRASNTGALTTADHDQDTALQFVPNNLYANVGSMLSINELRLAFQLQKFFEKLARGGSRYREVILAHFGTRSPDARMLIPEYLGGNRFPLSIHQVANQSQGEADFLGDVGAMSATSDVSDSFIKSFSEHGLIMGVMCARYDHTYSQGLDRMWTRKNMTDFYWPVFANIGEQPVYKHEIFLSATKPDSDLFGYNEAWCEYRFKPSRNSGLMRPNASGSLSSWHLGDNYETAPTLSDSWIREDKTNVDRVLAVTSSVSHQIFADIYVRNTCTRPMPMYSIPGLIDHH